MHFLSNFGCKITFMCSVNFRHQQDYNLLFKGSIIWSRDLLVQEAYWCQFFMHLDPQLFRGFIEFLCRRSVGFYSWACLVLLTKESKKRRQKQPGKLMAKTHSQTANLPGAQPLMSTLNYCDNGMMKLMINWTHKR